MDHDSNSSGHTKSKDLTRGFPLSAVLWFWFGIQKHDKNIYLPCVGLMVLDSVVIIGVVIYGQVT